MKITVEREKTVIYFVLLCLLICDCFLRNSYNFHLMLDLGALENKEDFCYTSHTSHSVEHTFRRHIDRGRDF